jgi:hypothetical protein
MAAFVMATVTTTSWWGRRLESAAPSLCSIVVVDILPGWKLIELQSSKGAWSQ